MHQFYLLFITLIASFFLVRPAVSQTDDGNKIHFDLERTRAVLSELIEKKLLESGAPSISIALVRGDSIVWKAAFGYSNVRTKTLADPDTLYNAGSTFKTVTATGIMKLVEEGKFKLEDPVNRYLGDYPVRDRIQSDKPVNFIHILSHWSGLTSWPDRGEATMKSVWGRELPNSLEQVTTELYSIRGPETKFEYNNYGYGLAGLLLERVSGVKYEQYISEHILRPLGITTPHPVYPTPDMVEMMAIPYYAAKKGATPRPAPQVLTDVYPAGGTAYLTAEDMARFLGALVNDGVFQEQRILQASSISQMLEPRFGGNYGLGLRVKKTAKGSTMIRHTGRMPGMSSMMMGDVDSHVGVYYATNSMDDPFAEVADAAISLLRGEAYPSERKTIQVESTVLDRYVGTYDMGNDILNITREGALLYLQKNNRTKKGELFAETKSMFFLDGDSSTISFEVGPDGEVERLVITSSDWLITGAKRRK